MEAEKILTQHPTPGKSGVNISREKYGTIREAMLEVIRTYGGETRFSDLTKEVEQRLSGGFEGWIPYVTTIKLDLEARGTIERVPQTGPQRLRLVI